MSVASSPCEHCGATFVGTTILAAEAARIAHEDECPQKPVDLDE